LVIIIFNEIEIKSHLKREDIMNMDRKRLIVILLVIALFMVLFACREQEAEEGGKPVVVTTTGQIWDAVRNIAGDAVVVYNLLGPGINPHSYIPTESDMSLFARSDIILWNGLFLEANLTKVLKSMNKAYVVNSEVPEQMFIGWEGEEKEYDPHTWNNPEIWTYVVKYITKKLSGLDPGNEELFKSNSEKYIQQIEDMDIYIQSQIEKIPPERRTVITSHDAFNYYGDRYGIDMRAIQGISTETEAGTKDIADLAKLVVEEKVPAVFVETSLSPKLIQALVDAVKARGYADFKGIGGELYSDALGEKGTEAESYLGMLKHNTDTIVKAYTE
jgi:manganese/zinc/iron transport system substrate-binding protein